MATQILVNIDSGNGLLPDGNINLRAISQEIPQQLISKINDLKFPLNLPETNESIVN